MDKKVFQKKIYYPKLFFKDLKFLLSNKKKILAAKKNENISDEFFERIMTVVSAVNGCVYCQWYHAKKAVEVGIEDDEVKNLLNLQFETNANEYEVLALLYAQHFAETNRKPDADMTKKFVDFYGEETSDHIMLIIRMIFFGNLSGNTFDSFLARFKGYRPQKGCLFFEFIYFLLAAPMLLPARISNKSKKKKSH